MRITKYGHSCLFIEEGQARILIDPGTFSQGFATLERLDAALITHQHQDHMVPEVLIALRERNPQLVIYADADSAGQLEEVGIEVRSVRGGETFTIAGVAVEVFGEHHAVIHPDLPGITNAGYLVGGRFFHPGDAFTVPPKPVEVLAIPVAAPWLKISEAIDYMRLVKPRVAIPIHDAVLSKVGRQIYIGAIIRMNPAVEMRVIPDGGSTEV